MSFVKLSIFGTSFEVNSLRSLLSRLIPLYLQVTTRYVDLQPVGMGPSFSLHFLSLGRRLTSNHRRIRASMVRLLVSRLVSFRQTLHRRIHRAALQRIN